MSTIHTTTDHNAIRCHFRLLRIGWHIIIFIVTVVQTILGEMIHTEHPTSRFWSIVNETHIMFFANATQLPIVVHGFEAFAILDGLPKSLVVWPDLIQGDLRFAIQFGADGRFVLVVRIDDDLFVAEVNELVEVQSEYIDFGIKVDTAVAPTADSEVRHNACSIFADEVDQRFERRNCVVTEIYRIFFMYI